MSSAFVRERDEEWLHDIAPTLDALINYLTRENNGVRVYEKKSYTSKETGKQVFEMSDGFAYSVNDQGKWFMLPD